MIEKRSELIESIEHGWSLPATFYTDPEILALEEERIFHHSWQYVGRKAQVRNIGDYITGYAGNIPVVVVRNQNGIEAFINVCRHRRHEVAQGCGNTKVLQCRYHAWTYELNGCLKAAPRSDREPSFNKEELPLLSMQVASWGPFLFVNPDLKARPLSTFLGTLPQIIANCGIDLDNLEFEGREEWNADANWKVMLENYLECYHCPVAHPGFSAVIDVDPDVYMPTPHEWFCSQVAPLRQGLTPDAARKAGYDATGGLVESQYHLLWPNLTININPGHANLSIDVWIPNGTQSTRGFSEQFFGPGVPEDWKRDLVAFNKQVGQEDDVLTNSVQRGLNSGFPERGRFMSESEKLVMHFQKLVANAVSDD